MYRPEADNPDRVWSLAEVLPEVLAHYGIAAKAEPRAATHDSRRRGEPISPTGFSAPWQEADLRIEAGEAAPQF